MITPDSPVEVVLGDAKPKLVKAVVEGLGLRTVGDLLLHFPRRYVKTGELTEVEGLHDGEMLVVPQQGDLRLRTEFGVIDVGPGEVAVIPRGVKLRAELRGGPARGYVCENYGGALTLPERGPIGANCLANPRDFLTPVAAYEDREVPGKMYVKWGGSLWDADIAQSPLDVVAWHGNYAPYKYDLRRYSPVGPILFDHADPSIFTVLTSPSETPGTANIDFVLFSDRWLVAENTFRPPWYHMNVMSEFMGLIYGVYDAKTGGGFVPGGFSLHNTMLPHGPDVDAFEAASNADLASEALFRAEAERELDEEEELFNVEENLPNPTSYNWEDKYRPRKPRYFNRVHTGYEWNKYNQTHYEYVSSFDLWRWLKSLTIS